MALPVADNGANPGGPAPTPGGYLTSSRKRACGNAYGLLAPALVNALPAIAPDAQSCILVMEAAIGAVAGNPLARFWSDGSWPTVTEGLPVYDGAVIEIIGRDDLNNFRMLSTDGLSHAINVQYFSGL